MAGKPVVLHGAISVMGGPPRPAVFQGEAYDPTLGIGGGPITGNRPDNTLPGDLPGGIWGGAPIPVPTPPIYIPVPPPPDSGLKPENPIYIPVYPAHPIVIPLPPDSGSGEHPAHPIYIPPVINGGPGSLPPIATPPIYIPVEPPSGGSGGEHPEHPIYFPVEPSHPIVLPPDGERPEPPPGMVAPPSGMRGFWAYSPFYDCWVFVPYEGVAPPGSGSGGGGGGSGEQPPTVDNSLPGDQPQVNPLPSSSSGSRRS